MENGTDAPLGSASLMIASDPPKSTVLLVSCLIPPPEPMALVVNLYTIFLTVHVKQSSNRADKGNVAPAPISSCSLAAPLPVTAIKPPMSIRTKTHISSFDLL